MRAAVGRGRTGLVVAILALASAPAGAQTRVYALFGGAAYTACLPTDCEPGRLVEIDVERGAIVRVTPVRDARYDPSALGVTSDGRYLVWSGAETIFGSSQLSAFDLATATQATVAALGPRNGFPFDVFVHPQLPKAYLGHTPDIGIVAPGVARRVPIPGCDAAFSLAVSGDASRLFASCAVRTPTTTQIIGTAVLDGASESLLRLVSDTATEQAASADGAELYSAQAAGLPGTRYRRWDVASNALLAEQVGGASDDFPMALTTEPRTGNLWSAVVNPGLDTFLQVLAPTTLQPLARFRVGRYAYPNLTQQSPVELAFDPDHPLAFVAWSERVPGSDPPRHRTFVRLLDTAGFVEVLTAELPFTSVIAGLAVAPRPQAPAGLSGEVVGRSVALRWSIGAGSPVTTSVEAGSAPGLANLAALSVPTGETSLVVPDVTPGAYFVRVRTRTAAGVDAVSNEILVTVR